ncbi:MAG: 1-acyl-sn-glycerol-3-phosphate acyltransferase [Bacteroidota bacterium]
MKWKIKGDVPRHLNKYLIIVAPHTSNWDFIIGLFVRRICKFKSGYLGKRQLFNWPFGWLFRRLGGYPVDRKSAHNVVDQVVNLINVNDFFVLAITPEGTRSNVVKWKTGFYFIAKKSGIPIVLTSLDYNKKLVTFDQPYYILENMHADELYINSRFVNVSGKNRITAPFKLT